MIEIGFFDFSGFLHSYIRITDQNELGQAGHQHAAEVDQVKAEDQEGDLRLRQEEHPEEDVSILRE